jgi:hypothetical protein
LPRLAASKTDPGKPLMDALVDLRIGVVSGELARLGRTAEPAEAGAITVMLDNLGRHFRALRFSRAEPPGDALLGEIDRAVAAFCKDPEPARRREALVLLTSLRRNLFPAAAGYGAAA